MGNPMIDKIVQELNDEVTISFRVPQKLLLNLIKTSNEPRTNIIVSMNKKTGSGRIEVRSAISSASLAIDNR